ncbi:MAG: hypothetical protein ACI9HK_004217 [Pirellulaceae bacterium]|jgi:hypothetical protein
MDRSDKARILIDISFASGSSKSGKYTSGSYKSGNYKSGNYSISRERSTYRVLVSPRRSLDPMNFRELRNIVRCCTDLRSSRLNSIRQISNTNTLGYFCKPNNASAWSPTANVGFRRQTIADSSNRSQLFRCAEVIGSSRHYI